MKKKRLLLLMVCIFAVVIVGFVKLICIPKHSEACKETYCYDISTKNSYNEIVELKEKYLKVFKKDDFDKFCKELGIESESIAIKQAVGVENECYCVLNAKGFELVYLFFCKIPNNRLWCYMSCRYPSLGVWDNGVLDLLHEEDYPREIMKRIHR